MSGLTGRTRLRVGGIFTRVLVLQVEETYRERVSGTRWPPIFETRQRWRDARVEDLSEDGTAPPAKAD